MGNYYQKNILNFFDIQLDKKYINKINIIGNSITKDKTLRSKLPFLPGDYVKKSQLKKKNKINEEVDYLKLAHQNSGGNRTRFLRPP